MWEVREIFLKEKVYQTGIKQAKERLYSSHLQLGLRLLQ